MEERERENENENGEGLVADYSVEQGGLSCIYVNVTPKEKFPGPDHLFSEARLTEVVLDYERGSNRLLGVEIITETAPTNPRPAPA